jgi:hypothetical protein
LHNTQGFQMENISVDCRGIAGTRGLAFGADGAASSSVKFVKVDGLDIGFCGIGMRYGDVQAPDIASNEFDHVYIHDNISQGISMRSGNGLLNIRNLLMADNGIAPVNGTPGSNIYAEGGQIILYDYVSAGAKPLDGDIVLDSAGIQVYGAWSDTPGPFVVSGGPSSQASVLTGIRHYAGQFTDTNTPKSVVWQSDNPLVVDGYFYGNIEVNSGNNALVLDRGVRFRIGTPHTTITPTFTGTAISGQHAYVGMATGAQGGRLVTGKPARTDVGDIASLEMTGLAFQPLIVGCIDNAGDGCGTIGYQAATAGWNFFGNAYSDGAAIKSIGVGPMVWLQIQGGTTGQKNIAMRVDDAASAGQTKFTPGTLVWSITYFPDGTTTNPILNLGGQTLHWSIAAPTLGTWTRGDVVFNSNAAVGQPKGWRCTVSGTPGTWVSEGNL